jgi:hypothetical protein
MAIKPISYSLAIIKTTRLVSPYIRKALKSNVLTGDEYNQYMDNIDVYGLNGQAIRNELLNELFPDDTINDILSPHMSHTIYTMKVVMFIDMVKYSSFVKDTPLEHVIEYMDSFFCNMDMTCKKYAVGKVETIGDAYLIVADCPWSMIGCAIEMIEMYKEKLRFGIHCGRIASCALGMYKLRHAYIGHAVNVAARLETSSVPSMIHVSSELVELCNKTPHRLQDVIRFEDRGVIDLKGVGEVNTYFIDSSGVARC